MRARRRRRWRRAGAVVAALVALSAVGFLFVPVTVEGGPACGSFVVRQRLVEPDPQAARQLHQSCDRALAKQGVGVALLASISATLGLAVRISRQRARVRYQVWRVGRLQAGRAIGYATGQPDLRLTPLFEVHSLEPTPARIRWVRVPEYRFGEYARGSSRSSAPAALAD